MLRVTIAGASGFVGSNLVAKIRNNFKIKALSRKLKESDHVNVEYFKTDLFSLTSTSKALENTDVAIYLVHSMKPSSRLFQGNFHDTDLILADNFIHACKKNGVKQIIYLGGIVPEGYISKHLESRKEVEGILKSSGIPCTILRAGMVVGNGGSSFEILKNLVHTLPGMILPKWTASNTQIIYLDDLIDIIEFSINNIKVYGETINIVNGEVIKYRDLIVQTKQHLKKKSFLIPVPINYTAFSKLWVSVFGKSDYELVSPLIESLLCDFSKIIPSPHIEHLIKYRTYRDMLKHINIDVSRKKARNKRSIINNVRSIQRLPGNGNKKSNEIVELYMKWLPRYMKPLIKVKKTESQRVNFYLIGLSKPLLTLQYIPNPADKDRVKLHIVGGLLTDTTDTGWLEFRDIENGKYFLASINEFFPSLPWYIYKFTQAPIHKLTMMNFGKFLNSKKAL